MGLAMPYLYVPSIFLLELLVMLRNCFFRSFVIQKLASLGVMPQFRMSFSSALILNSAISLLRTFSSGNPGSLIAVVVGDVRKTILPGANVSQSPHKSRFDRLHTFLANFNSSDFSVRGIGFVYFGWRIKRDNDLTPTVLLTSPLRR